MKTKRILLCVFAVLLALALLGGVIAVTYNITENALGNKVVIDKDFNLPVIKPAKDSSNVDVDENGITTSEVTLKATGVVAVVPSGTLLDDGVSKITLTVKELENSQANITLEANEESSSIDVHIEGISANNTTPIKVYIEKLLPVGLNMGNYKLYHVENGSTVEMTLLADGETPVHNNFEYDTVTGDVNLYLASFSEIALVADTENAWNGEFDTSWYNTTDTSFVIASADELAGLGQIVGGMAEDIERDSFKDKEIKLIADINLGDDEANNDPDKIFHPIGYYFTLDKNGDGTADDVYSTVYSFEGTFDGNGHTIANFYQNTWEIKGDYDGNYYNDAMGLFGYVFGGTVQNLTVDNFSSDGEFTPTGVIAAFADGDCTFNNIAITNCNPRVYNTGNGGIIGIAGDTSTANDDHITLQNITVDNSNKISALWGSWDVACGGLVGMYRGNVDGNGEATGDTISFTNCHVAAQIDVYNDVCANYQYYAYRYAGMIIGSVRHNTTNDEGRVIPNMAGISASGCTVNYGDWNDYYYCEFVKNSPASYSEDYQFSRVDKSEIIFDENGNITGCIHAHTEEEDKTAVYLPFHQLFTGYSWGVSSIGLEKYSGIVTDLGITEGEDNESVVKFDKLFTGDFLYRVGNGNAVSLGSLFEATDGLEINNSGVWVTIDKVDENSDVSGTFTANTTYWTQGSIQFTGTGVVKVTIQDYNYCTPTTLLLEVVDAKNATTATSATSNNVVLLNDVSGSFSVSGGYTFYGNGFEVTLPTTYQSNYSSGYVGYVYLTNGNLDNVRIEGPVYPEMYIYRDQAQDSSDTTKANYFYNSVLINGGNCTISNSYISGSRTAVCIRGANNVVLENTTLSGGAYANMQIAGGSSVTLRDLTTVQVDVSDSYGKDKTTHGLGIAVDSAITDLYIEGELNQYNWLCETQWDNIVPSDYQSSFPDFFGSTTYSKYWHYLNGGTDPYVNMTFIYACNWDTDKIHDNRTTADYGTCDSTIAGVAGGVYSKLNTVGGNAITNANLKEPVYISTGFNPVAPVFNYDNIANDDADDENDDADTYCTYDESTGTLKIGITENSKVIDLSGLTITKNGVALSYDTYLNDTLFRGNTVTINSADGTKQVLTFKATDDAGYDKDGNPIDGTIEYTWTITLEVATLAYPAPVWNMNGNYTFDTTNCYYAYYSTSQGYGEAVPIYEGIKINYYNKSGTLVELDLSGTTTLPTGSENSNSNAFTYTLSDGSILTMKFSSGWKSGATTHQFTAYNNKAYIYPQSLDNDNYIRAKTTNQDFNVKITYTFTDPNGQSTETVTMNWYNAAASNGSVSSVQWKTFDSTNGKEPSVCATPDTLVTMADGTQKEIQYVTVGESVIAWNFYTGKYEAVPASLVQNHGSGDMNVLHLYFEDGTELKVLGEHGIYDYDLNTFIFIDEYDVENYIGHNFVKQNGDNFKTVKLVDYKVTNEYTSAYTILSTEHYNVMLEDMFTVSPAHVGDNFFNPFEVNENMMYDEEAVKADIEKYGLYTYEEFAHVLTYEQFEALGIAEFKVSVGKGLVTYEGLIYLIENFVNKY